MNKILGSIPLLVGLSIFCSGLILLGIYPYRPNTLLGWSALFLISMPLVICYEYLGDKLLSTKLLENSGRGVRILYGVVVIGVVVIGGALLVSWLKPYLGEW